MNGSDETEELLKRMAEARAANQIASSTELHVRRWLTDAAFRKHRAAVAEHVRDKRFKELDDVFWTVLPFGTGGRRGRMYPIGTNVMNERTVGESAQGLATYLREVHGAGADLSCVIAFDTRNGSEPFARLSASVLAGNRVRVYLFRSYRATPQLSFAVRHLGASAGIVISASHNPPSDNGFKCSWSSGGQVLPPHDKGIIDCVQNVREITAADIDEAVRDGLIVWLGPEHDEAYIEAVASQSLSRQRSIRIVYTPLHGVGMTCVHRALERAGFADIHVVESQATPDGNFPNVPDHAPNPENPAVLAAAMRLAEQVAADLVLASDPDADRIAAAVPGADRQWVPLSGNQVAGLLAEYVVTKRKPTMPDQPFVVKTLVTTDLISRIAEAHGVRSIGELPVGFKWIADAMDSYGPEQFLFGAEESLGYLVGTYARDKDAAVAGLLLAELAAELKAAGTGMLEHLDRLYLRYGYHIERAVSKSRPGREGAMEISQIMEAFRTAPPPRLAEMPIRRVHDFVTNEIRSLDGNSPSGTIAAAPQQQVMFEFERPGWRIVARPSGTEPKIKFYLFGVVPPQELGTDKALAESKRECDTVMQRLVRELDGLIEQCVVKRG